ncbi:ABC transporter ATP-binding protein [Paenibacillus thermoaerophilus]|jgi:putative ABC transport system ATP-binding protein|uniref:ABC transporter ATP-binding protein n=1 Tax=Paenibacillus thermoaerophilus TaxID=1215385 RepID=A0ABW2V274_9BACL|nr:ABC transporter ATP-binding protein [Paenibacillus thermoaerophilus]TMV18207.1 ABC transporter ATP-binding protein [Paenibacillus thermoaerophilus]
MIRAIALSKTYGRGEAATKALREVDLEIGRGEMVSIMGPSGCGKTTLLQLLAGIDRMSGGEVWFGDRPLHKLDDKELSRVRLERMGFIFQAYHLVPVLTAAENVALPLIARGLTRQEADRRAVEALKQVGLETKARRYPYELSGGQNQRVAIARAVAGEPDVIWADEPTGALDSDTSEQVIGLLRMLNRHLNTTIVIVTHDPRVAEQTDRTIAMHNGRILDHGDRAARNGPADPAAGLAREVSSR